MSSQDSPEEIVAPFLTVEAVIFQPIATLLPMFLTYGVYIIIFGLCMHVLYHRDRCGLRLYLVCIIMSFILTSLYVAWETFGKTHETIITFHAAKTQDFGPLIKYLYQDSLATGWIATTAFTSTFMIALADIMLIHRFYVLWGSRKVVLFALGFMGITLNGISFATAFLGSIGSSDFNKFGDVYLVSGKIDYGNGIALAVFNGILSLLTAGRIWWISREARQHMGMPTHARYRQIVTIILESGILFPTAMIASNVIPIIVDPNSQGVFPVNLDPIVYLMAGIAPTLIIVRVAYRKSVDSVQQMVSAHFAECESQQEVGNQTLQTTLGNHAVDASSGHPVDEAMA
ncbi:hypothetical protein PQX77_019753 [Marasmius sp. AFHP31]|nr:hypothetical protein PQX77_019753 [Marasmius sp. AFHP31]